LDFLLRQAMQAVLTHRRFWLAGSAPRRDFFLEAGGGCDGGCEGSAKAP
jgi:hypothetical protein